MLLWFEYHNVLYSTNYEAFVKANIINAPYEGASPLRAMILLGGEAQRTPAIYPPAEEAMRITLSPSFKTVSTPLSVRICSPLTKMLK